MHVKDALVNMSIRSEKKAAMMVKEAIRSAYFNAINNHDMDGSKLTVGAEQGRMSIGLVEMLEHGFIRRWKWWWLRQRG